MLGVFWGTGVGGGLILDGKPWLGRGGAGEIGHMVVRRGGAHCPCGRRGCMEAYAGRSAMEAKARREVKKGTATDLFKLMKERGRTRLTSSVWANAIAHEDPLAIELIDRAVKALGAGIASAVNLLDVEAVIIGGGLACASGSRWPSGSPPRCTPTCSTTTGRRRSGWPGSGISAAGSAPRCWSRVDLGRSAASRDANGCGSGDLEALGALGVPLGLVEHPDEQPDERDTHHD